MNKLIVLGALTAASFFSNACKKDTEKNKNIEKMKTINAKNVHSWVTSVLQGLFNKIT